MPLHIGKTRNTAYIVLSFLDFSSYSESISLFRNSTFWLTLILRSRYSFLSVLAVLTLLLFLSLQFFLTNLLHLLSHVLQIRLYSSSPIRARGQTPLFHYLERRSKLPTVYSSSSLLGKGKSNVVFSPLSLPFCICHSCVSFRQFDSNLSVQFWKTQTKEWMF